ncbi:MAG: hypothetical protein AB7F35_06450 [Acetobacteraceae bacterium]
MTSATDPTAPDDAAPKSNRGGRRPGAGRKKKGHTSPSSIPAVDIESALAAPAPDDIETAAQKHARSALGNLVKQMLHGKSDASRIKAAEAILDRGYGKPSVEPGGELFLPFLGNAPARELSTEIRDEARKHANLSIEVLRRIADGSDSDAARVSAAKSLLDRGLGTVAAAKLPEGRFQPELGKKESALQAARDLATGRYATPPPPRGLTH